MRVDGGIDKIDNAQKADIPSSWFGRVLKAFEEVLTGKSDEEHAWRRVQEEACSQARDPEACKKTPIKGPRSIISPR